MKMNSILFKKLIAFVLLFTFCVAMLEISSYLIWTKVLERKKSNGVFKVKQIIGLPIPNQLIVSNPYSLYWNNPDFIDDKYGKQFDQNGYRSPDLKVTAGEIPIKVLALGGSTTNQYPYIRDRSKIWTSLVQKELEHNLHRPVHVFNAGIPYGTTAELLVHYFLNAKHLHPDIIVIEAGSDVTTLMFPNYKTDYSHFRKNTASPDGRPFERTLLKYSYTLRVLYASWLMGEGIIKLQPYEFSKIDNSAVLKIVKEKPSIAFESNMDSIVADATRNKAKVLLVGLIQAKPENVSKKWPEMACRQPVLVLLNERHNSIMSKIAAKYGQSFLSLDPNKMKDEYFLDNIHLGESGDLEKSKEISAALLRLINVNK